MSCSTDLGVRVIPLLVAGRAAVLGGDGQAAPGVGRGTVDESKREEPGKAGERKTRLSPTPVGTTTREG